MQKVYSYIPFIPDTMLRRFLVHRGLFIYQFLWILSTLKKIIHKYDNGKIQFGNI